MSRSGHLMQENKPRNLNLPLSAYARRGIYGFTVLVNREVLEYPKEAAEVLEELQNQIKRIVRVVPRAPLRELRRVRIWLEWINRPNGAAEYHVSAEWLRENGYNPQKAGDVEINNARNFVRWSRGEQPWMLMHELAHAYHHRVLGYDHPWVEAAYRKAMIRKLYEQVDYVRGGKMKAYACTNAQEYFAELTESYFGQNDFYPFTREDLKRHDPVGYTLMTEVWGEVP